MRSNELWTDGTKVRTKGGIAPLLEALQWVLWAPLVAWSSRWNYLAEVAEVRPEPQGVTRPGILRYVLFNSVLLPLDGLISSERIWIHCVMSFNVPRCLVSDPRPISAGDCQDAGLFPLRRVAEKVSLINDSWLWSKTVLVHNQSIPLACSVGAKSYRSDRTLAADIHRG